MNILKEEAITALEDLLSTQIMVSNDQFDGAKYNSIGNIKTKQASILRTIIYSLEN